MNKYSIYALRDKVADTFSGINLNVNDAVAKRDFSYAVNNTPELEYKCSDIELYKVGEFDVHTGCIVPCNTLVLVCRGDEVISND